MADAVVAEGLAKRYGSVYALDGLDLTVPEGGVLGLLGPDGAGKTTTLRILSTLLRPDEGRVRVAGVDLLSQPHRVRTRIGLSGQHPAVDVDLTGHENLELIGRLRRLAPARAGEQADDLLARFGLTGVADRQAGTYSAAMRRRLDLAGALVGAPPVILLDEPTRGLDPAGRMGLWDVIAEQVLANSTVVLATEHLEEADQLADDIVVIDKGRQVAHGSPEALRQRVGGDRLQVVLGNRADTEAAAHILDGGSTVDLDGHTVTMPVPGNRAGALVEAVRRLDKAGVEPSDIGIHRATLDDVLRRLAGQPAASGGR